MKVQGRARGSSSVKLLFTPVGSGVNSGGSIGLSVKTYGAFGDGTDQTVAIKAAFAAAGPTKSEIYFPDGDYLISDTIVIPETVKKVTCAPGARLILIADKVMFYKRGTLAPASVAIVNPSVPVGNKLVSVSAANSTGFAAGDWILIRCNDLTPNVTAGSRVSFLRRLTLVNTVSGVIYFESATYRAMTTGMSIRKVELGGRVVFSGGTFMALNQSFTRPLCEFVLCYGPDFNGVNLRDHGAAAIKLAHCMGGSFNDSHIYNLLDDKATGHFGYGVVLTGTTRGFKFNSGTVGRVRHAITTATFQEAFLGNAELPVLTTEQKAYIELRGEPEACYYGPVYCYNTTNAAFDTHEQGYGITITPNAHGCFEGIHVRCSNVTINGGQVIGCRRNAMRVSMPASNPVETVNYKISIKGLSIHAIASDGEGGDESAGINVLAPGAELDISDITVTGYQQYGIRAQAGTRIIVRGGTFDGTTPAGQTAIQLESSNNIVRGALIRNNAIGLRQEAALTNNERLDVIYAGNTTDESIA